MSLQQHRARARDVDSRRDTTLSSTSLAFRKHEAGLKPKEEGAGKRSLLLSMRVGFSDNGPTLCLVQGRAKPVLHGPNGTESNQRNHIQGESYSHALEQGPLARADIIDRARYPEWVE